MFTRDPLNFGFQFIRFRCLFGCQPGAVLDSPVLGNSQIATADCQLPVLRRMESAIHIAIATFDVRRFCAGQTNGSHRRPAEAKIPLVAKSVGQLGRTGLVQIREVLPCDIRQHGTRNWSGILSTRAGNHFAGWHFVLHVSNTFLFDRFVSTKNQSLQFVSRLCRFRFVLSPIGRWTDCSSKRVFGPTQVAAKVSMDPLGLGDFADRYRAVSKSRFGGQLGRSHGRYGVFCSDSRINDRRMGWNDCLCLADTLRLCGLFDHRDWCRHDVRIRVA